MEKAIVLLSGGLDSRLAVKLLQEKYEVIALHFKLPFGTGCCDENCSFNFSQLSGVKLEIFDCTKGKLLKEYLKIVKKPKYGYGTCLNPCIDCRIFMLKKAKEYADKNKIKIIATGEVVGERPMSQTSKALKIIDKEVGFDVSRPLSELGIEGRRRDKQIELAKKYNISYPTPGGGCLLCEKELKDRVKCLLEKEEVNEQEVRLIKIGRHFEKNNIIIGKNSKENEILEKEKGIKIVPEEPGPTALITDKEYEAKAKELIQKYSKNKIKKFLYIITP
ncbi:MAG: 7-cyano-7-deazaguanine synthase [archaeon]|nr:7-cyano-7-deazaguanine synthase [archaeon]